MIDLLHGKVVCVGNMSLVSILRLFLLCRERMCGICWMESSEGCLIFPYPILGQKKERGKTEEKNSTKGVYQ